MESQVVINALIALNAVQFLVIALAIFRLEKNVPPQIVEALFNIGRRETAKTPFTWDEEALEQVIKVYQDLNKEQVQDLTRAISQGVSKASNRS
jgi:hypothetical protein